MRPLIQIIAGFLFAASLCHAQPASSWIGQLAERPYHLQFLAGFASDQDFGPSLLFLTDRSREHTYFHGISIGSQISDTLFGYDVDVVVFLGMQNFLERGYQPDSYGVTAYWKGYREWRPGWLPVALPIRFGLGQGLSYVSRIPVAEQRDFLPRQSAETVHYLEWSVQLPINGLLGSMGFPESVIFDDSWLGYTIFHRSTVFGLFAESGGGINFPGLSIEFVLN